MKRFFSKPLLRFIGITAAAVGIFGLASAAFAQVSIDFPSSFGGFSSQDVKTTIENIVQIVLGFLGIIFLLLILYAGFTWMTSQGEQDKINRAKKIIASAVIGLLVTLAAYSIAGFIISNLQQAVSTTNGPPGGGCTPPGCLPIPGCTAPTAGQVKVCSVTTPSIRGQVATIKGYNFGVGGGASAVTINGQSVATVVCGPTPQWNNQRIDVEVTSSVPLGTSPNNVVVTEAAGAVCSGTDCGTTNVQDGTSPFIRCMSPAIGLSNGTVQVTLDGKNFGVAPGNVEMEGATGRFTINTPLPMTNIGTWNDDKIVFTVPGGGAPQQAISGDVTVIDSSAVRSNDKFFTVSCAAPADCASGCCFSLQCHSAAVCAVTGPGGPNGPVITAILPVDAAQGNFVTIQGRNFGGTPGTLRMTQGATNFVIGAPSVAACASTWWSDTQIIMEIPGSAVNGATSITVTNTATTLASVPWTTFRVDSAKDRPGLCNINPNNGYYQTVFDLDGNNFAPSLNVFFGTPPGISSNNVNFISGTQAQGDAPNLTSGRTTVAVSVVGENSNPLYFTVNSLAAGDPRIASFNPGSGPAGTYVTILGSNFGNLQGLVYFVKSTVSTCSGSVVLNGSPRAACLADMSFPPICSSDIWRDDRIIVKIPSGPTMNSGSYFIVVRRPDGKQSQESPISGVNGYFGKKNFALKPGLCRIDPLGGPEGTVVRYDGEHFGFGVGSLRFDLNRSSVPSSFSSIQAIGTVPTGAVTGTTSVATFGGFFSNHIPFFVGSCTSNAQCGSAFCCSGICRPNASCSAINTGRTTWSFTSDDYLFDLKNQQNCTTGGLQSPTPYPFDQAGSYVAGDSATNAPVNSAIAGTFTRDVDFLSIYDPSSGTANIKVYECTSAATFGGSSSCSPTQVAGSLTQVGARGWKFTPNTSFNADRWYEVRLDDGTAASNIRAIDGSIYSGSDGSSPQSPPLGAAGTVESFRWHFKTRASAQALCDVSSVVLTETAMTVGVGSTSQPVTALPVSSQCYICSGGYAYEWNPNPMPPDADYSPLSPPDPADTTQFFGQNITTVPVSITARIPNPPSGTPTPWSQPMLLSVDYIPPRVISYNPKAGCQTSCSNISPIATFNVDIDTGTISNATARLLRCTDATCTSYLPTNSNNPRIVNGTTLELIGPGFPPYVIAVSAWYRVILLNTITNTQGQQLNLSSAGAQAYDDPSVTGAEVNGFDSFSWIFKTGSSACIPSSISIVPANGVINAIGRTLDLNARATGSDPVCGNVNLNPNAYQWSWQDSPAGIVSLNPTGPNNPPATRATGLVAGLTQVTGSITTPALSAQSSVQVIDNREPVNFIGHRPDNPPGGSPPEDANSICDIGGTAAACTLQCTNVLTSALFSTYLQASTVNSTNFAVVELPAGTPVPGTLKVTNYSDPSKGICSGNPALVCSNAAPCPAGTGSCGYKRGRIDFTPDLSASSLPKGIYASGQQYEVRVCQAGSCAATPITSTQGIPFAAPRIFRFTTGTNICQISFVEITPNPAVFADRQMECSVGLAQCTDFTSKTIVAQAKDSMGVDLSAATYTWRETAPIGPYSTNFYDLTQSVNDADATHKGLIGLDFNEVAADGGVAGTKSAQGVMDFSFCENPWLGDSPTLNPYYLDTTYDFKLSYCMDSTGSNPSDPATMLPQLPSPHLVRTSPGFGQGGDLLKEHIFIVGGQASGTSITGNAAPYFTTPSNNPVVALPGLQSSYRYGDLVSFTLKAKDPDGDNYRFVMHNSSGDPQTNDPSDLLPASASFNPATGAFIWVVDKLPTTDTDGDTNNDFSVRFSLNPTGAAPNDSVVVNINVISTTPPPQVVNPVTEFTSVTAGSTTVTPPGGGTTITADYGQQVTFNTNVTSYGGVGATTVRSFVWDFQDSGLSAYTDVTEPTYRATHVFLQQGPHQVTFRVQNDLGVWSLPAAFTVLVRPKVSLLDGSSGVVASTAGKHTGWLTGGVSTFVKKAFGQTLFNPPTQLTADSIGTAPDMELKWQNASSYATVAIYRDGTPIASGLPGSTTTYVDLGVTVGTTYIYRVCGVVGTEKCTEVTVTARNTSYDVIVARVYKNLDSFSVSEWYKAYAPNPVGSPRVTQVDGYDAIVDGTSVYIGVANCTVPGTCNSGGSNGVYTNVLLLSYNQGAKPSTVEIFNRLVSQLRINDSLTTRDDGLTLNTCSGDATIICDPGHDTVCAAKNAGLCQSAKAELRRDYRRIVALHDIAGALYTYAADHTFCDDGSNSIACRTDADCPNSGRCVGVFPALTAGSYLGGISTSKWPSWKETLAQDIKRSDLPHDPIDRFGANFYSATPAKCSDFAGHDANTCWNERSLKFQCHEGSEVFMYQNVRGSNFNLYGLAEAPGWIWKAKDPKVVINDPTYNDICNNTIAATSVCGNGVVENAPSGDIFVTFGVPRKLNPTLTSTVYLGSGSVPAGTPIKVFDGATQTVVTDATAPNQNSLGIQVQRMDYNGAPRVHIKLQTNTIPSGSGNKDYESQITIQGGSIRRLVSDSSVFGPSGSPLSGGPGFEGIGGACAGNLDDRLRQDSSTSIDVCMETTSFPDQFYLDIDAGREVCDGGSVNYCDATFGQGNWNGDFRVGCKNDCSGWGDPYAGNTAAARAACGGSCGDAVIDPSEQCDPAANPNGTAGYSCTGGSPVFCSSSCQIACAQGRPYSGACGNGIVTVPEVCDEGGLNGTTGHCNKTCSGYDSFCGDGTLTPLNEYALGCVCDSTITGASCSAGYTPIYAESCTTAFCSGQPQHKWSCVKNVEECDNVVGLTSYSCPANSSLYCDSSCNRACSGIDVSATTGQRRNVAVYEHYFVNGDVEDYDYTLFKKTDTGYSTKGIAFYAYAPGSAQPGTVNVYRHKSTVPGVTDYRLSRFNSLANYQLVGSTAVFETYLNAVAGNNNIVPVYEFLSQPKPSGDIDYYYSRNKVPRNDNQSKPYLIQNAGNPVFWVWVGPFQESCGNGTLEGNESCEPDSYQIPTPSQSSANTQYACGQPFTPNACRVYGGYCGDATKDSPFEQCDEGTTTPFHCAITSAVTCTTDLNCQASTCGRITAGLCDLNNTLSCTKDSDCPQNGCVGNGASCNNNANNCTYCTASCSQALLPRNYCGDGIVNCGLYTPNNCADQDPYTEVCDDGTANNGKPGQCNETCTGKTGAVCGNNIQEGVCSGDTSISCNPSNPGSCPAGKGTCGGELCDDGNNNGRWTYTCRNAPATQCANDADCPAPNAGQCTGTPYNYCSFSCLGRTPAVCGDSIVQQPNWGPDRILGTSDDQTEYCDNGIQNGTPGFCNATCNGITPAICGDGIVGSGTCSVSLDVFGAPKLCQTNADCAGGPDVCVNGESCDPPASQTVQSCTDAGKAGLQTSQCSSVCQAVTSQCHAYGLKIWSDGVDLAYLNGSLMLLPFAGAAQCFADPDLQTMDYTWPTSPPPPAPFVSANQCTTPSSQVPDQAVNAVSDVRPVNAAGDPVADAFEINGKNVVAVKIWAKSAADPRSFEAVYTSPTARRMFPTISGQTSAWACSHVFTSGWEKVSCPSCDPTLASGTWRRPFSYTSNPSTPRCNTNYTNQVGGTAQWIWGDDCKDTPADGDPVPDWVYCRLEYISSGTPVQAAWNPNYGWVHMSTAGAGRVSVRTADPWPKPVQGAAWNRNLGWLHFDGTDAADSTNNPTAGVTIDGTTGQLTGQAWGVNYGRVIFNPADACGGSVCSDTGLACPPACSPTATCDVVNCTQGFGPRSYTNAKRSASSGVLTGYAWSEKAGWIDFSANSQANIIIPEL